jgi:hypothetical protein
MIMNKKQEGSWHVRFRSMKKGMGFTNVHIARITGNSYDSIKSATQPKLSLPRWARLSVVIYETLIKDNSKPEDIKD